MNIFVLFCVLGTAFAGIDRNDCHTHGVRQGEDAYCQQGFAAVGLCTSGGQPDCSQSQGWFTILKCCRETGLQEPQKKYCQPLQNSQGVYLECTSDLTVNAVCTSGSRADCGNNIYTRIQCCDDHSQTVITSTCQWINAMQGHLVECADNQIVTGVCSSGHATDCRATGTGYYTSIRCCSIA